MAPTKYRDLRIGFLGRGKMFQALAGGFMKAGLVKPKNIVVSNIRQSEPLVTTEEGFQMVSTNNAVVKCCDVVIIAVKPHIVPGVLAEIRDDVTPQHLIISIAAGLIFSTLDQMVPAGSKVVRVTPNTPALVGCGTSAYCCGLSVMPQDEELVVSLFQTVGLCEKVPERLLDAVTGVSGSGPAYGFMAIEALSDGGVKMGLPRNQATKFAAQMLLGAAKMVLETGLHPGELKDGVCSPGGATIAAVHSLEKNGFRAALIEAVEASTIRAKQLGQQ